MIRFNLFLAFLFTCTIGSSFAQAQMLEMDDSAAKSADVAQPLTAGSISTETNIAPWTDFYKNFSFGFFNITTAPYIQANNGTAQVFAYNYVSVGYRLSQNWKIGLQPVFTATSNGMNASGDKLKGDSALGDGYVSIQYRGRDLPLWDLDSKITMRIYAPTSEGTAASGTILRIRPELVFEKWFNRSISVEARLEPDYYVQSRTASLSSKGRAQGNRNWGYNSIVGPIYHINRNFGAQIAVGYDQMSNYTSATNGIDKPFVKDSFKYQVSMLGSIGPVFFIAGATQKRDPRDGRVKEGFMRATETEYFLLNYWTL